VNRGRRAALLLEVLLALALFVMTALAILSIVRDAVGRLESARERLEAADLARSAMAAIEAGLYRPAALNGPVPVEGLFAEDDQDSGAVPASSPIGEAGADRPSWTLEIDTQPSEFPGLSLVTVSVLRDRVASQGGAPAGVAVLTLDRRDFSVYRGRNGQRFEIRP